MLYITSSISSSLTVMLIVSVEPLDEADQAGLDDDVVEAPSKVDSIPEHRAKGDGKDLNHHLNIKTSAVTNGNGTTGSITSTGSSTSSSTSPQDSHNDSGYSTRIGFSAGPSPSLSSKLAISFFSYL